MTTETTTSTSIALTDVAAAKVAALLAQEGRDDLYLRVAVQPGGEATAVEGDDVVSLGCQSAHH